MGWRSFFRKPDLPAWIIRINYISLLPIIVWPLVFFGSIFIFDNPQSKGLAALMFILINAYPLLLVGNMRLSFRLFHNYRWASVLLALLPLVLLAWFLFVFLG